MYSSVINSQMNVVKFLKNIQTIDSCQFEITYKLFYDSKMCFSNHNIKYWGVKNTLFKALPIYFYHFLIQHESSELPTY